MKQSIQIVHIISLFFYTSIEFSSKVLFSSGLSNRLEDGDPSITKTQKTPDSRKTITFLGEKVFQVLRTNISSSQKELSSFIEH